MLEPLRDDSEGQSLDFGHSLIAVLPVAQHARQGWYFGQPAAISFALRYPLSRKRHEEIRRQLDARATLAAARQPAPDG